jgi:Porin PorA
MRRTASPISLILLGLGTFLLVLAPLLAWYVTPRAALNPINIDQTAVYRGTGSVFDTEQVKTVPDQRITVTQRVRGNVEDSERSDGAAVWDVTTTVDTDKSLPAADPHDALEFVPHRWVMDRKTTKPVHCCGEKPYIEGEAYLKFPFDVQRRSYQWWDNSLGSTVTLHYQGTKKVQGYTGYRFTGTVAPAKVGTRLVPGTIVDQPGRPQVLAEEWYSNHGIELVVDQRTGRVVYAQVGPKRTLRAPGAKKDAVVLLDSQKIAFTTATQKEAVRLAKRDSGQLRAVGVALPIGAAVAGFVLAAVGGVLVVRGRRRPESTDMSDTPEPALTM